MSADQSVTATFGVVATGPQPGSYSGSTSQGWGVSLYVSADGVQVQDINLQTIALTCTPSAPSPNPSPDDSFHIASIPINADESFSSTTGQTRVIGNAPVHVTYTFSGQFTGTHVAGSVREDISYDGTATTCTSNTLTWTASRENQGNQAALGAAGGQLRRRDVAGLGRVPVCLAEQHPAAGHHAPEPRALLHAVDAESQPESVRQLLHRLDPDQRGRLVLDQRRPRPG